MTRSEHSPSFPARFKNSAKHELLGFTLKQIARFTAPEYSLSEYSPAHLLLLKNVLRRGESALVYFNHISQHEAPLQLAILTSHLGGSLQNLTVPVSYKHYRGQESSQTAVLLRLLNSCGIHLYPVIQHYERNQFSSKLIYQLDKAFFKGIRHTLTQPSGIVLIAPEGTRSSDGTLQPAQLGIAHFQQYDPWFVPVGVTFDKASPSLHFNFGIPFKSEQLGLPKNPKDFLFTDALMLKLAERLPPDMRGYYAHYPQ